MGTGTIREYMRLFGVTEETGVDLPSEASPLVANLDSPRTMEYITAGYGQGVAITPIAMTRALATLANKGAVPQPHVGLYVEYPDGTKKELGWSPPRQAIRPETAETVTNMLVEVVDTALRHGDKKIPELSVAAKTGTAQIANPGGGGYYKDRYLHSFFGYFPAHDARFIVFLYAVEPKGAQYASETLTDPFFSITKFLMTYYNITPDRTTP
jgi:cell division protein FtsI/penicillin-binding protein 2